MKHTALAVANLCHWLLSLEDPGSLGPDPLSDDKLAEIRADLSKEMWKPATSDGVKDQKIEEIYREFCGVAEKLRRGLPASFCSHRIHLPKTGVITVIAEKSKRKHEVVFLELLQMSGPLLRRCKKCEKVFIRRRRQKYCGGNCRIRDWRENKKKGNSGN